MRYSERENFVRVLTWDNPSHVCYQPPCRGVCYNGAWPGQGRPSPDCREWQDIWGATWEDVDGEVFPTRPAIPSIEHLDELQAPDPAGRLANAQQQMEEIDREQYFLTVSHPYLFYEKAFNILGPAEFLAALACEPEKAHRFLDMLLDFELGIAAQYVELKPDHVSTSDDYGMQDRLSVSPAMWREFFKPRLQELYNFYRNRLGNDVVLNHHSCGHVMPILPDFIELGLHTLHPLQTTANDLAEARRISSGKLVIAGAIDGQHVLPFGTPDEVRQEVFAKLDLLWEGGGYMPMPEKMLGVSAENKQAMEDAIEEWSAANVER